MKNYDIAKNNYNRGTWTEEMIGNLVKNGKITGADYEDITGQPYTGEGGSTITTAELDEAYKQGVQEA